MGSTDVCTHPVGWVILNINLIFARVSLMMSTDSNHISFRWTPSPHHDDPVRFRSLIHSPWFPVWCCWRFRNNWFSNCPFGPIRVALIMGKMSDDREQDWILFGELAAAMKEWIHSSILGKWNRAAITRM
jgi:hypothetical protein